MTGCVFDIDLDNELNQVVFRDVPVTVEKVDITYFYATLIICIILSYLRQIQWLEYVASR